MTHNRMFAPSCTREKSKESYRVEKDMTQAEQTGILEQENIADMSVERMQELGMLYNEKADYVRARKFFSLALKKVESEMLSPDRKNLTRAACYYALANCERALRNFSSAINLYLKAKGYSENIITRVERPRDLSCFIARDLGITYLLLENYWAAIKACNEARDIAMQGQVTMPVVISCLGLAKVKCSSNWEEGFKNLEEARLLYPLALRETSLDWALHRFHMGEAYLTAAKFLARTTVEKQEFLMNAVYELSEAKRLSTQVIADGKSDSASQFFYANDVDAALGDVSFELGQKEIAMKYLQQALDAYIVLENDNKIKEVEAQLQKIQDSVSRQKKITRTKSNMWQDRYRHETDRPVYSVATSEDGDWVFKLESP